ncbi:MAG: flagellar assembly protein FliW, partial [Lachnospiraceae bacterium]|nr:flagellar assembly protein FliW [Lachnospiraceae bacterium]
VPTDLSKMSVNLKAPFVINVDTRKAVQVVLEDDLPVKFYVYELLKARKENARNEKK